MTNQTLYVPTPSPPTPSPSPSPSRPSTPTTLAAPSPLTSLTPTSRLSYLSTLLSTCTQPELEFISRAITPLLSSESKQESDYISLLPNELCLGIALFLRSPRDVLCLGMVSRKWAEVMRSGEIWKNLCVQWGFGRGKESYRAKFREEYIKIKNWKTNGHLLRTHRLPLLSTSPNTPFPIPSTSTSNNSHSRSQSQTSAASTSPVTCLALSPSWIAIGLASARIHVFSATTGVLARTLVGHESGVWGLGIVCAGGKEEKLFGEEYEEKESKEDGEGLCRTLVPSLRVAVGLPADTDMTESSPLNNGENSAQNNQPFRPYEQSSPTFASEGWGQPNALIVSGGCDKVVRVWDVVSGHLIYTLSGHTSTIRCLRMLHNAPIAVTGSRDGTLRSWDVRRGRMKKVMRGHDGGVRCLDVCGTKVVSGGYDPCARIWDLTTGECIHVLRGHYHQIYSIAFDGIRVVTGGLDTSVRVWDAETGKCLVLLQGHTSLVCALQLSRKEGLLATGASDGRVVVFYVAGGDVEDIVETRRTRTRLPLSIEEGEDEDEQDQEQFGGAGEVEKGIGSGSNENGNSNHRHERRGFLFPSSPSPSSLPFSQRRREPQRQTAHSMPVSSSSGKPTGKLTPYTPLYQIHAHPSSITSLQFDRRFLITSGSGGNGNGGGGGGGEGDGVKVWEIWNGKFVRNVQPRRGVGVGVGKEKDRADHEEEGVWKVGFVCTSTSTCPTGEVQEMEWEMEDVPDVCVVAWKGREGRSIVDVWGLADDDMGDAVAQA